MIPDDTQALMDRRARALGPAYRLFYETPLRPVRGEGVWLHDADGKRYLDAYNNVASVGHCHPHVVEAIARQAGVLNTHTRYLHEGVLDYAERLLATMPAELAHAMFTCTGSEANDLAMRIACAHTKADGLIVTHFAYHGVTSAIAGASPSLGRFVQLGHNVRTVPAPDTYRIAPEAMGRAFADGVHAAIADMQTAGMRPAALMVDTSFSSDGIFTDPPGFIAEAVEAVREAGGHEELFAAGRVEAYGDVAAVARRVGADVDGDIENGTGEHPDQLGLGVGRDLKVQAAEGAGGGGEGLVVLQEAVGDAVLGELVGAVDLREPAAVVAVALRDHPFDRRNFSIDDLHPPLLTCPYRLAVGVGRAKAAKSRLHRRPPPFPLLAKPWPHGYR